MTYFHSYWTRPLLDPARPAAEQELVWWDFEALTWLWSGLEIRRHSPLRLVTDTRGRLAVERAGLEWLYTAGISTTLDDIAPDLDAGVFWAAGKLHAYRDVPVPCVSVDTDAVLWQPLAPSAPVMVLHAEDRAWWWYARDEASFSQHGFAGPEWDWSLHPINAAVVYLADDDLRNFYADTAIRFMEGCSRAHRGGEIPPNAMLFAEQRLLPMCARQLGRPLACVTEMLPGPAWIPRNADCLHLWGAKRAYKSCPDARIAAVDHLRAEILRRFPEARPTLTRWGLEQSASPGPVDRELREQALLAPPEGLTFSLLRAVCGRVWIHDRVTGARRLATEDSMMWSGEVVEPEPGAGCELLISGVNPVRVAHDPSITS
jgi:hypothetical protein